MGLGRPATAVVLQPRNPAMWQLGEWRIVYHPRSGAWMLAVLPSGQPVSLRLVIGRGRGGGPNADGYWWWNWNGDTQFPSLRNSIQGDGWHGWMDKGEFVKSVPDKDGEDWW